MAVIDLILACLRRFLYLCLGTASVLQFVYHFRKDFLHYFARTWGRQNLTGILDSINYLYKIHVSFSIRSQIFPHGL